MDDNRYKSVDAATAWGCGIALLIGLPIFLLLLTGEAIGDCEPGIECHSFLRHVALPTAAVMTGLYFLVRTIVNRRRDDR